MRILSMYEAKGTYYCYFTRIFAIYPNRVIIPTSLYTKTFSKCIQNETIKLVEKPT